jgi:hypothetical protein
MKSVFLLALGLLLVTFGVNALHEFSCNALNDGGFEMATTPWLSFNGDLLNFAPGTFVCGNRSLEFTSTTGSGSLGAYQLIDIAALLNNNYKVYIDNSITWEVEGFSRASNVDTGPLSDYSLYVDYSADGVSRGAVAFLPYSSGTHDWEKRITYFTTPASGFIYVYVLFRSRTGTAWFDAINLKYKQPEVHNLLANGGFEYDTNLGDFSSPALGWVSATSVVGYTIADISAGIQFSHSLLRSAKISIMDGQSMWIQEQIMNLNPNTSIPMLVSAWSMAASVTGPAGSDYSLYLDVAYAINGVVTNTTTFIAPYTPGSHDWQLRQIFVPANPPAVIARIFVNLVLRSFEASRSGIAYFDDVSAYYVDNNMMA